VDQHDRVERDRAVLQLVDGVVAGIDVAVAIAVPVPVPVAVAVAVAIPVAIPVAVAEIAVAIPVAVAISVSVAGWIAVAVPGLGLERVLAAGPVLGARSRADDRAQGDEQPARAGNFHDPTLPVALAGENDRELHCDPAQATV